MSHPRKQCQRVSIACLQSTCACCRRTLPSEIAYNSEAAGELAQRYPSAYKAALAKEVAFDARQRETIIPALPLVFLPGSCTLSNGKPLRPNYRSGTTLTLYFSDKKRSRL